jgi:hypothetical protein
MPTCPQCTKPLRDFSRRCPSCQADLDLLVDYVSQLQGGNDRADNLARSGELGKAFWAYLEVLETDPDNAPARRQVGQVVTAVRQFDRVAPGRRWLTGSDGEGWRMLPAWVYATVIGLAVGLALTFGIVIGAARPFEKLGDPTNLLQLKPRELPVAAPAMKEGH